MKLFFSFLRILCCDLQSYENSIVNETLMYIPSMYQVPTRERFYEKDFKSIKPRLYGFMDLKKPISNLPQVPTHITNTKDIQRP